MSRTWDAGTAPWGEASGVAYYVPVLGRICLSLIFLISGITKFTNWAGTLAFMESKGMPSPAVLLALAALIELICGLLVLVGYQARWAALILALYLIPATLVFHNFWGYEGLEGQNQMQHFLKNLAIFGGLLMVVGLGPGALSADASASRARLTS